MTTVGVPAQWLDLIDSLVPDILASVIAAWETMDPPGAEDGEDKITQALCRALRQDRTARGLPFQIQTQLVELEPLSGTDPGRMDVVFVPTQVPREDIYFCLEAKRLNVVKDGVVRAYAFEYVTLGMARFVAGQYARSVRHAAMIAYVLDGNTARAIANVQANIRKHRATLRMDEPGLLLASQTLQSDPRARETQHRRDHEAPLFLIHHLFLSRSGFA